MNFITIIGLNPFYNCSWCSSSWMGVENYQGTSKTEDQRSLVCRAPNVIWHRIGFGYRVGSRRGFG